MSSLFSAFFIPQNTDICYSYIYFSYQHLFNCCSFPFISENGPSLVDLEKAIDEVISPRDFFAIAECVKYS